MKLLSELRQVLVGVYPNEMSVSKRSRNRMILIFNALTQRSADPTSLYDASELIYIRE